MKIGIVGFGRFGQLWADALLPFSEVLVYDSKSIVQPINTSITVTHLQEVAQADIVFLLVPISAFKESCLAIKELVNPTTLIVDCCSVKIYPVEVMRRVFGEQQPLLATHPLFGPDSIKKTGSLMGHKIVICPINSDKNKQNDLEVIFNKMGLKILVTTPEDHDKQMANSQGLVHFLGRGLQALDIQSQELATPDFTALLNINSMVAHDTWQLFLDMQRYNPYVRTIRKKLIKQLISIDMKIEEGVRPW